MRLRNRRSTVAVGPDAPAPKSRWAALTQALYIALLLALLAYLLLLGWRYATRLQMDGQVLVATRVLGAPQAGMVMPRVARGAVVEAGDPLAAIDPQLLCDEPVLEDRRLVQLRDDLRVKRAEGKLLDERLERLRQRSPASSVQRALELDRSRGDALRAWREELEALEDERELAAIEVESLGEQLAEVAAQAALRNRLAPACRAQTLSAPEAGEVVAVRREPGEFIERGEPLILLRARQPRVWIEVFAAGDELAALAGEETAMVTLPDGHESRGRVVRVESAAADAPRLETQDYVPVGAALRVILEAPDAATAAQWRRYPRMNVKVMVKR